MDWKKLTLDLIKVGLTQVEIGEYIGLHQAMISDLVRGKRRGDLGWSAGQKLLELHARHVKSAA